MDYFGLEARNILFSGPQVTWAGEYPLKDGFCFGTEDGTIQILDRRLGDLPSKVVPFGEPITGVALTPKLTAISTPGEILIYPRADLLDPSGEVRLYDGGSHGVISTTRGGVIAPLGQGGLLHADSTKNGTYTLREIKPSRDDIYFYRVRNTGPAESGDEVFACAGREHGLLAVAVGAEGGPCRIVSRRGRNSDTASDLDIVDVCSLGSPEYPRAVAGLGIDATLHLWTDILRDGPLLNLRFPQLPGTGYSLLSAQGHIFILTSERLCVLPHLAARFLRGEHIRGTIGTFNMRIDAVDCSLAYGEFLMLIKVGAVSLIEVSKLSAYLEGPGQSVYVSESANVSWEASPMHDHSIHLLSMPF